MTARSGRRAGNPDTRAEILRQARLQFGAQGFDRTTLRAVAHASGVDVALISHYFGNKRGLFLAATDFPADPDVVLSFVADCPIDNLGRRLVEAVLGVWDSDLGPALAARFRTAMSDTESDTLRDLLLGVVAAPLRRRLADADHLELRISLFAGQLAGLLLTRQLIGLPELAQRSPQELAALVGPSLQRYLTGPLA